MLQRDLDGEALEEDDNQEDHEGGEQVHDVGQVGAVEGVLQGTHLARVLEELLEHGDDGTLELSTTSSVDGEGRERLPDDGLTDAGRDEQGDTRAESVSLLEELVKQNADHSCDHELGNDEHGGDGADVTVHAGHHVREGLNEGDDQTERLLGTSEELTVLGRAVVHREDLGSLKKW